MITLTDSAPRSLSQAERAYRELREAVFAFRLLPGDRFTESDVARQLGCSRTPVREALTRLQNENLVKCYFRSGWEVVPIDFTVFTNLYETRSLIEVHAVEQLCLGADARVDRGVIDRLGLLWRLPKAEQVTDISQAAALDEDFHLELVRAAGNDELVAILSNITARIRIMRRLDFEFDRRIYQTYDEHVALLDLIAAGRTAAAKAYISEHIEDGHREVSRITVQRLQQARVKSLG